jgi:hypothetical protein
MLGDLIRTSSDYLTDNSKVKLIIWMMQFLTNFRPLLLDTVKCFSYFTSKLLTNSGDKIINMFDYLSFKIFPYREYEFSARCITTTFEGYNGTNDIMEIKYLNTFSEKMKIVLWYLNSNENFIMNNYGSILPIKMSLLNNEPEEVNLFCNSSPTYLEDEKYGITLSDKISVRFCLADVLPSNSQKHLVIFDKNYTIYLRTETNSGFEKLLKLLKILEVDYNKCIQAKNGNALLCSSFRIKNSLKPQDKPEFIVMECEKSRHNKTMVNVITEYNDAIINILKSHVLEPSAEFIAHGNSCKCTLAFVGKPGTGKTSLIKAISHYTDRNMILIQINMFKSIGDMKEHIMKAEDKMRKINNKDSIWVFEEFDCFMAKSRTVPTKKVLTEKYKEHLNFVKLHSTYESYINRFENFDGTKPDFPLSEEDFDEFHAEYKAINENNSTAQTKPTIKLGDLLTFFDGVIENYNSISIITTNHPELMDKAFTRNKRMDLLVDLSNMSLNLFEKFYKFYFNQPLPKDFVWPEDIDIVPVDIATYYDVSKSKFKDNIDSCSKEFLAMVLSHVNHNTTSK